MFFIMFSYRLNRSVLLTLYYNYYYLLLFIIMKFIHGQALESVLQYYLIIIPFQMYPEHTSWYLFMNTSILVSVEPTALKDTGFLPFSL